MKLIASSARFTDYDFWGPTEITGMAIYVDPDVLTPEVEAKAKEVLHHELNQVRRDKLRERGYSAFQHNPI